MEEIALTVFNVSAKIVTQSLLNVRDTHKQSNAISILIVMHLFIAIDCRPGPLLHLAPSLKRLMKIAMKLKNAKSVITVGMPLQKQL